MRAQSFTFAQSTIPTPQTVVGGDALNLGDLWSDNSQSPPQLKICTAINPIVFTAVSSGGGGGPNFSDEEIPGGTINGVNVTFTLANAPNPGASLLLHQNGLCLQQGSGKDYTLSGSTITFTTAPATNDILLAWYRH